MARKTAKGSVTAHPPLLTQKLTNADTVVWPANKPICRVHSDTYSATQFNPGKGNARFSPIKDSKDDSIPTLYGAETKEGALMESIFHDIPHAPGLKTFDKTKLDNKVYSVLAAKSDLTLADLSNTSLRKYGIKRSELIDTEKSEYAKTQAFAERMHADNKDIQGLYWISRQDDRAEAIILFEDRIPDGDLIAIAPSVGLLEDSTYSEIINLARKIGVNIVPGKKP